MTCEVCGTLAETRYVELYQNVGALVMRFSRSLKGQLCRECISKHFWQMTLVTLILGWWGIISFFLTPIFLVNNIYRYVSTRRMPDELSHPMGHSREDRLARLRGE